MLNCLKGLSMSENNLLISEPFLSDTNFLRSVILLCERNEEGAMGLVLNKPTDILVGDVVKELSEFEDRIYIGGPVAQNTLHFIHRHPMRIEGDIPLMNDLYWGGNFKDLLYKLKHREIGTADIRFFLGYSGWSDGQLDAELEENAWIEGAATPEVLFENAPEDLWRAILKNMGGKYREFANYPIDPRMN